MVKKNVKKRAVDNESTAAPDSAPTRARAEEQEQKQKQDLPSANSDKKRTRAERARDERARAKAQKPKEQEPKEQKKPKEPKEPKEPTEPKEQEQKSKRSQQRKAARAEHVDPAPDKKTWQPKEPREGLPRKWKTRDSADDWKRKEHEKRNCVKYHWLKFMERQKVERKLKTSKKLLLAAAEAGKEEDVKNLRNQLQALLADHEYIEHYPKHLPYNALFPKEDSDASRKRREEIRKLIRQNLEREEQEEAAPKGENLAEGNGGDEELEEARKLLRSTRDQPAASIVKGKKKEKLQEEQPELGKKKRKVATAPVEKSAPDVKPKKHKKAEMPEDTAADETTLKERRTKKQKTVGVESKQELGENHPSWQARKSAKLTGALVRGAAAAKPTVFGSDSE